MAAEPNQFVRRAQPHVAVAIRGQIRDKAHVRDLIDALSYETNKPLGEPDPDIAIAVFCQRQHPIVAQQSRQRKRSFKSVRTKLVLGAQEPQSLTERSYPEIAQAIG